MEATTPRRDERNTYFGYLALDNIDQVYARLRRMIGNGQRYVFVATNENLDMLRPEVRIDHIDAKGSPDGEAMKIGDVQAEGSPRLRHITVLDTYGVFGFGTSLESEHGTRKDRWTTEFAFEGDTFRLIQRTGAGGRVSWTIKPVPVDS